MIDIDYKILKMVECRNDNTNNKINDMQKL